MFLGCCLASATCAGCTLISLRRFQRWLTVSGWEVLAFCLAPCLSMLPSVLCLLPSAFDPCLLPVSPAFCVCLLPLLLPSDSLHSPVDPAQNTFHAHLCQICMACNAVPILHGIHCSFCIYIDISIYMTALRYQAK